MGPVIISLGANLGDRRRQLDLACRRLQESGFRVRRRSSLYLTRPWGGAPGPHYLNALVEATSSAASPLATLERCRAVEAGFGRDRRLPYHPRRLDVDLIAIGDLKLDHPRLKLPHPHWGRRDFVIMALIELGLPPPAVPEGRPPRQPLLRLLAEAPGCIAGKMPWT